MKPHSLSNEEFLEHVAVASNMVGRVVSEAILSESGPGPMAMLIAMAAWSGKVLGGREIDHDEELEIRQILGATFDTNVAATQAELAGRLH
jgi:hypothetical protein